MTKTFQVKVRRDGKWWYFEIPEVDMSGQARRLAEVEFEATDIIATWLKIDAKSIVVTLDVDVPVEVSAAWREAKRLETIAREENAAAALLAREAVKRLRDEGMSQADAGRLLGVTVQRVSQLEGGHRTVKNRTVQKRQPSAVDRIVSRRFEPSQIDALTIVPPPAQPRDTTGWAEEL